MPVFRRGVDDDVDFFAVQKLAIIVVRRALVVLCPGGGPARVEIGHGDDPSVVGRCSLAALADGKLAVAPPATDNPDANLFVGTHVLLLDHDRSLVGPFCELGQPGRATPAAATPNAWPSIRRREIFPLVVIEVSTLVFRPGNRCCEFSMGLGSRVFRTWLPGWSLATGARFTPFSPTRRC